MRDGRVRYHFVIVDFLCHAPAGEAVAGTDAEAVAWVAADELQHTVSTNTRPR